MSQEHIEQALQQYQPTDAAIADMAEHFRRLEVTGLDDRAGLAKVHAARMEVRGLRVRVEKTRKELKKDALEYGRRVDGEAKRITEALLAIEEPLAEKESIVAKEKERLKAIAAEERKAALQVRLDALAAVGFTGNPLDVQEWTEGEYEERLYEEGKAHKYRVEEEERRKADEAIAAQELAEEREKLRVEREAMEAASDLIERKAEENRAELEIKRLALEAQQRELESQRQEAKRAEEIKEAKEQAVLDAKIREAEAQAEREAEEAELERLRPQYEKIHRYAQAVFDVPVPDVDCKQRITDLLSVFAYELGALGPTVKAEEVPE